MGYLYRHIRLDKNEPFYFGIGGFNKNEKAFSYNRARDKRGRNKIWNDIVNKTDYKVEIIFDKLNFSSAIKYEIAFIKLYGRIDKGTGILVNMTDGGEGTLNRTPWNKGLKHSKESIEKMKISQSKREHIPCSQETKNKIGEANKISLKGNTPWNKGKKNCQIPWNKGIKTGKGGQLPCKIRCINTGIIYDSIKEAETLLNAKHIGDVCRGKRNHSINLKFEFID